MRTNKKMKTAKTKIFLIGFFLAVLTLFSSCAKDSILNPLGDCFGGNWAAQYANELTAWSNAATAYNEDPTPAKCADYKTASKNYLDALREVADCVPTANRAEIDESINEAKADVDKEGCD